MYPNLIILFITVSSIQYILQHTVPISTNHHLLTVGRQPKCRINRKKQHLVKVRTFNVRTLRTYFRAFELQKLAADLKIDILVIQEHRRSTSDVDFQHNLPKGWQILLGAPSAPGYGSIGFLLSSRCSPWLLDYKFVTDRVAVASFDIGNRRLHIVASTRLLPQSCCPIQLNPLIFMTASQR